MTIPVEGTVYLCKLCEQIINTQTFVYEQGNNIDIYCNNLLLK